MFHIHEQKVADGFSCIWSTPNHSKYIFYLQEDVWLQKKVDFDLFLKLYEIVVKYNINALRIVNKTDPNYYKLNNTSIFNGEISKFKNNSKYS